MGKNLPIINKINSYKGFTLIELLVVLGILGILAAALLAAINPIEQLNKAQDASMEQLASEMASADSRAYTANNAQPASCNTLNGVTLNAGTGAACVTALITAGELKPSYANASNLNLLTFTNPNPQTATDPSSTSVCFKPLSHTVQTNANTKFTATGATGANCLSTGGATACYWCAE